MTPGVVTRFATIADILDAAGLGPADYLYPPLKRLLKEPQVSDFPLKKALLRTCKRALSDPPSLPRDLRRAPILAASSYVNSVNLLRQVVTGFEAKEAVLCDATDHRGYSSLGIFDRVRLLRSLAPALIFTVRVRSTLMEAGVELAECNRIALAAFVHRMYRQTARAILKKVRPKCLVIGNGNRPFELSMWAEARARGIATVLLPYLEISLGPARFLSLCRGAFDLVLPFSEYSAAQMRKLRPDIAAEVVGFPACIYSVDADSVVKKKASIGRDILYVAGTTPVEELAAEILREAFADCSDLRLRVRLHPRRREAEMHVLFGWLSRDCISDPVRTKLVDDIAMSDVMVTIGSTVAFDAMIAGVPTVWLTPKTAREKLELHPIRRQKLALIEATSSVELRMIVQKLIDDQNERKRVVEEQWSRLRVAGYNRDYFAAVRSALRRVVGVDVPVLDPNVDQKRPVLASPDDRGQAVQ